MAEYLICKCDSGTQIHALFAVYPKKDNDLLIAECPTCISMGKYGVIESAKLNNVEFGRRESEGGTLLLDEGIIEVALNGDLSNMLSKVMSVLKIDSTIINNDIIVNNKKIVGMAEYNNDGRKTKVASLIFDTPIEKFDKYLNPTYKHDSRKVSDRITSLKAINPSITKQVVIDAILNVYKSTYENSKAIDLASVIETDEYIKKYNKHCSELWITWGLTDENAYSLHNIKINGMIVDNAKIGTTSDGSTTLSLQNTVSKKLSMENFKCFTLEKVYKHKVYDEYKIEKRMYRVKNSHKYTNCMHYVLEEYV